MTKPAISVVVCTMPSRLPYLGECLASLAAADGSDTAEVLVVAREGDDVSEAIAPFAGRLKLRRIDALTHGLSDKRNVGAAAACSEVVAYLDDDATVRPDYLTALRSVFAGGATAVAGAIEPVFRGAVPPELEPVLFSIGGFNRHGGVELADRFIGANCAFRREFLLSLGPFDTRFGPGSTWLPWGDDSEMFRRAAAAGVVRFAPEVTVFHSIQTERLTRRYLLTRAFGVGRTNCVLDRLHQPRFFRRAVRTPIYLLRSMLTRGWLSRRLEDRVKVCRFKGYVTQFLLLCVRGLPQCA